MNQTCQNNNNKLLTSIHDQHSFNFDVHPKPLHDAYELLEDRISGTNQTHQNRHHEDRSGKHGGRGTGRVQNDCRDHGEYCNWVKHVNTTS